MTKNQKRPKLLMSLFSAFRTMDNKFPWSFTGVVIGIIGLSITIFVIFQSESKDKIDLKILVEDEFNLIELKEVLPNLQVLYNNEDIVKLKKEIKIIIYSFINDGKIITQDFYDYKKKFAIAFDNSIILSTEVLSSNSKYLQENFLINKSDSTNSGIVDFNKLIFEKGKKITLKTYLIQNKNSGKTRIEFLGKIAGLDDLPVQWKVEELKGVPVAQKKDTIAGIAFFATLIGLFVFLWIATGINTYRDRKAFDKKWNKFIEVYPEYISKKNIIKWASLTFFKKMIEELIKDDKILIDFSKFIPRLKYLRLFAFLSPVRTISFPKEIFINENNIVSLRPEFVDVCKKYYVFNNNTLDV